MHLGEPTPSGELASEDAHSSFGLLRVQRPGLAVLLMDQVIWARTCALCLGGPTDGDRNSQPMPVFYCVRCNVCSHTAWLLRIQARKKEVPIAKAASPSTERRDSRPALASRTPAGPVARLPALRRERLHTARRHARTQTRRI